MLPERRRPHPIEWAVLVAVLSAILSQVFFYGKLAQKVDDLAASLAEVRAAVFAGNRGSRAVKP